MPEDQASRSFPEEIKQFYSAGTTFSMVGCASAVQIVWAVLVRIRPYLSSDVVCLVLSFAIVYAYAFVVPEPKGYRHEGGFVVTASEAIFGVLNALLVCGLVFGLNDVTGILGSPRV